MNLKTLRNRNNFHFSSMNLSKFQVVDLIKFKNCFCKELPHPLLPEDKKFFWVFLQKFSEFLISSIRLLFLFLEKYFIPSRTSQSAYFIGFFDKLILQVRRIWTFSWETNQKVLLNNFLQKYFIENFCCEQLWTKFFSPTPFIIWDFLMK